MSNQIMNLRGFDTSSQVCDLKREQPFSDLTTDKHYGMPISTVKFLTMLYDFWKQDDPSPTNPFGDVYWVNFSKASLFRILAQEDVEYVRFYFAIPDPELNKASLALEGIKGDHTPVKLIQTLQVAAHMTGDSDLDPESPGHNILELTGGIPTANNEEKGNGGPPLERHNGSQNVSSLKRVSTGFTNTDKERTFKEFIEQYYLHATENFI